MQYQFSEWMANRGLSRFRAVADSFSHTFIPDAIPPGSSQQGTYTVHVRRNPAGTSDFRRSIYDRDLWARLQPDVTGRYRECSPDFYTLVFLCYFFLLFLSPSKGCEHGVFIFNRLYFQTKSCSNAPPHTVP